MVEAVCETMAEFADLAPTDLRSHLLDCHCFDWQLRHHLAFVLDWSFRERRASLLDLQFRSRSAVVEDTGSKVDHNSDMFVPPACFQLILSGLQKTINRKFLYCHHGIFKLS